MCHTASLENLGRERKFRSQTLLFHCFTAAKERTSCLLHGCCVVSCFSMSLNLFGVNITLYDALLSNCVNSIFASPFQNKMRNLFPMFGESCANGPKSQERWQKNCVKKTWDVAAKLLAQSLVVVAITQIVRCCDPWICSGTSPRSTQLVWNKTTEKLKTWLFFWLFYYILHYMTILIIPRIILYTNTIRVGHSEFPCDDMDKSVTKTLFFNISHVRKVC